MTTEPLIEYLQRKLREAGAGRWEAIAKETGVSIFTIRKVAYRDTENPGIKTMQPLLDLFLAIDDGKRALPEQAAA